LNIHTNNSLYIKYNFSSENPPDKSDNLELKKYHEPPLGRHEKLLREHINHQKKITYTIIKYHLSLMKNGIFYMLLYKEPFN